MMCSDGATFLDKQFDPTLKSEIQLLQKGERKAHQAKQDRQTDTGR